METTNSNSTIQIIVIIILVVITIALFTYLIIVAVKIPPILVTPFANGSKVKIRSLANNLYLKPISCSQINGCDFSIYTSQNFCNIPAATVVAAIGQYDETGTTWQLCEYSGNNSSGPTGEAKYLVFQGNTQNTTILRISNDILSTVTTQGNCVAESSSVFDCALQTDKVYFSFILNQKTKVGVISNTTSGSYQIFNSCDITQPLFCSGQGNTNLNNLDCPPFVLTANSGKKYTNGLCEVPNFTPICALNYLFEIDVI